MHTKEMSELEGTFTKQEPAARSCLKCKSPNVTVATWESDCGGYEDEKFTCGDCGHYWWVEGPDA